VDRIKSSLAKVGRISFSLFMTERKSVLE